MKNIATIFLVFLLHFAANAQTEIPVYLDDKKPTEERISDVLKRLTLEEKIALIHAQSKFSTPGVPRLGIPEIWMSDGPHGVRPELLWDAWNHANWTNDSAMAFPALTCLAATFNPKMSALYGKALGEESRFRKKDIILGPGCNIYRTPMNGRNFEYLGEDPFLASEMIAPYIQAVQKSGVAACVKHYALNNQERWRDHIDVRVSERALREIYLPAFKAAVQRGKVWSVMGAYNKYNGQFASHNEILMNKILKEEWGFDGVVITDWGSAHDTKEAALYGLDIEMGTWTNGLTSNIGSAYDNYYMARPLLEKIKNGEIDVKFLDEKVRRVLRLNLRTNMNRNRPWGSFVTKKHKEIALKVAEEGIVLLKNTNNFFPIPIKKYNKILIVGENATKSLTVGGGSSELKVQYELSPLEAMQKMYGKQHISYTLGYSSGPSAYGRVIPAKENADSLVAKAVEMAKSADVVLFFGGLNKNHHQDCEGGDRLSYALPFGQNQLLEKMLAANSNIGVILVSGNAVAMPWVEKIDGIMQSWYLGSEAGSATANVVSGKVSPSGKMPFSIAKKLNDYSSHHYGEIAYPGDSIRVEYKEGIFVGYRWLNEKKIDPQFAFGHGLSYSSFQVDGIELNKKKYKAKDVIKVKYSIKNTGKIDAAEVVQVYVGMSKSKVERAPKELKAFKKTFLKAGQTSEMELQIDTKSLSYFNEKKSKFELEKGEYILFLGTGSDKILKKIEFEIR